MAFIRVDMFSKCLMRTVPVTCIVPVDNVRYEGEPVRPADMPYKTLYLLNGLYGNNLDWSLASNIYMWAQEHNLVVVMPAGENKFYVDNSSTGEAYGRFIGEELVEQTRRMFRLSRKREDTFIGGLSMGGYGAIRNGLKYAQTFGYIIGLSSGIVCGEMMKNPSFVGAPDDPDYTHRPAFFQSIFGDADKIDGSENDPKALFVRNLETGIANPRIYLACGSDDFVLHSSHDFRDFLTLHGADFVYDEGPGAHDFVFWNEHLRLALQWLPLEEAAPGISSGNVRRE